MKKRIALIRGINVGGKRKVHMKDLKVLFEDLGFTDVVTYIQSGNVIFNSNAALDTIKTASKIEQAILKVYGFEVPVVVIIANDMQQAAKANPFLNEETVSVDQLHVTFLQGIPNSEHLVKITSYPTGADQFILKDQVVYLCCQDKYHKSKLSNTFFETKLKVSATTRNWKTVVKLVELSC
ncbi:DUF1697 domain-containing protein [Aquimarina agarilytica]|uniref:DUF1697 domain-containing protein n=1 Tax=Aquimarina agarilytica TaxID=1087449 RepID=UPI000287F5EB|nr:DUF1697 domain-containing protein [Aquimarina agarilytica]